MKRNSSKATALIMCIKKLHVMYMTVICKKWNLAGIWIRSHGKKNCEFLPWLDLNLLLA